MLQKKDTVIKKIMSHEEHDHLVNMVNITDLRTFKQGPRNSTESLFSFVLNISKILKSFVYFQL